MLISIAGTDFALSPGEEHETDQAEALRYIEAGYAVPVEDEPVEIKVKPPAPERRAKAKT